MPPSFTSPERNCSMVGGCLTPFNVNSCKPPDSPSFLRNGFTYSMGISNCKNLDRETLTSNPSLSVNCHSEKSRVSFSRAGNPRPFLPPHGHRSSLSLNSVVDQSRQMWSRFGAALCPLTPMVECHRYSVFKLRTTHRIMVNLPMGANLKLKALRRLARVSIHLFSKYLNL